MMLLVTLFGALAVAAAAPNIFQIDLEPEVAAKYINNPPFTSLQLSGRTAVLPLIKYNDPRFRTAEAGPTLGHYWKNGKEIENTDDYVEEVYDAAQFHGQDGLGAYAYGYRTPESAKAEAKQRSGDVQGSYIYKAGSSNNLIKVRYWADSQGFHQEDNIPKYVPKPVEEAPEVKAARLAHEKAWNEAAYNNLHPAAAAAAQENYYNQNYQNGQGGQYSQGGQYNPNANAEGQYNPGFNQEGQYNSDFQTSASEQQRTYVAAPSRQRRAYDGDYTTTTTPPPEPTGPPRGFFYSFNYPVSIIVPKNSLQGGEANQGYPVDYDTVSVGQKK